MAGYRSFLWSCKRGIVGHDVRPVADDGQAWLSRISQIGMKAIRLRGIAPATDSQNEPAERIRAARHHLRRAQRLLRELGEIDLAEEAALLRDCVK